MDRWRSERCERTFAHVCETGGGRRTWLRGQTNVSKAHTFKCAAYNLGLLLRKVWGLRKPRSGADGAAALLFAIVRWFVLIATIAALVIDRRLRALQATILGDWYRWWRLQHRLPCRSIKNYPLF